LIDFLLDRSTPEIYEDVKKNNLDRLYLASLACELVFNCPWIFDRIRLCFLLQSSHLHDLSPCKAMFINLFEVHLMTSFSTCARRSWDDLEKNCQQVFCSELPVDSPLAFSVPAQEPLTREKMVKLMFETFNIPAICFAFPRKPELECGVDRFKTLNLPPEWNNVLTRSFFFAVGQHAGRFSCSVLWSDRFPVKVSHPVIMNPPAGGAIGNGSQQVESLHVKMNNWRF
jgi:hypothetical protein